MTHPHAKNCTFYGLATVGAKGQIVIPAKARDDLNIQSGDAMVIIGIKDRNMLGICPVEHVEAMLAEATKRLKELQTVVDQTKTKGK